MTRPESVNQYGLPPVGARDEVAIKNWFESLSIKARLFLLTSVSSAVGLIVAGMIIGWQNYELDHRELRERLQTQASVIAANSADSIKHGSLAEVVHVLNALRVDDEVLAAEVRGADETVLAHVKFDRGSDAGSMDVGAPILDGEKLLGSVHLRGSAEDIEEALVQQAIVMVLVLFGALGLALLATSMLHKMISRPVSELAQAKAHLEIALASAEKATRAKSEFLANMSHEIRTPMNGVVGMLDLLHTEPLEPEARSMLETARNSADALLTLINDVLDFSKIDAGKLTLEKIDFEPRPLAEEVATLFTRDAAAKGLELSCAVHNDVPEVLAADPTRLRQIMANLVANAVKFTSRGEVLLGLQIRADSLTHAIGDTVTLQIVVQDTGIGMTKAVIDQLFVAFTQADNSTTRKYGGSGLGLAITHRLVAAMGGSIKVISEPGRGSTFSVFIPVEVRPRVAAVPVAADLSSLRILIVDDNPTNRCILEHYLVREGAAFASAASAREGLQLARSAAEKGAPFDVVLLDYQMPELDGVGFLRELRADAQLARMRCIVLSSLGDRVAEADTLDVAAWLTKPVRKAQLHSMLIAATRHHAAVAKGAPDGSARPDYSAARVLLVEDNRVNKEVALRMLKTLGVEAMLASDGAEAVTLIAEGAFDLVLMDCQMPVMDGYAATGVVREREAANGLPRMPIVAMTANALEGDREKCLAAGMDDYAPKPIKLEVLGKILAKWLQSAPSRATPSAALAESATPAPPAVVERSASALDLEVLAQLKDLMGDGLPDVIDTYLNDTPVQLEAMTDAIAARDAEALGRAAHSVKSSSMALGAVVVSRVAEALELHVHSDGTVEQAQRSVDAVRVAFEEAARRLRARAQEERTSRARGDGSPSGTFVKEPGPSRKRA